MKLVTIEERELKKLYRVMKLVLIVNIITFISVCVSFAVR